MLRETDLGKMCSLCLSVLAISKSNHTKPMLLNNNLKKSQIDQQMKCVF